MTLKLGKNEATEDTRDWKLSAVVDVSVVLPKITKTFGHEAGITFGMDGNGPDDSVLPGFRGAGDCVFAGADHEVQVWQHAAKKVGPAKFNGATAIKDYSAVTGYIIGNDSTDQGTNVRDALRYRAKTGIVDINGGRHKIVAYLALDPGNMNHLLAAMYLFDAVGIGIKFPASAMDQFNKGKEWTVVKGSPIEGGHYIPLVARRSSDSLTCVSWGRTQRMSTTFFETYCDEAWALLSQEAINAATQKSPEGFSPSTLKTLLKGL